MRNIRKGDLVKFSQGRSCEIEKVLFPESKRDVYLVVSSPKMSVYSDEGSRSGRAHETLTVEIAQGIRIKKVPVNILEVYKDDEQNSREKK
tara:strand:- start:638 stop:910 length:273 start_codon:yes stop_codon:yes gene_type:complete